MEPEVDVVEADLARSDHARDVVAAEVAGETDLAAPASNPDVKGADDTCHACPGAVVCVTCQSCSGHCLMPGGPDACWQTVEIYRRKNAPAHPPIVKPRWRS
jgi:hypothetical protein